MKKGLSTMTTICLCIVLFLILCSFLSPVCIHDRKTEYAVERESDGFEPIPVPPQVSLDGLKTYNYIKPLHKKPADPTEYAVIDTLQPAPTEPLPWREDVPLSAELQVTLLQVCQEVDLDPLLALGLIEMESNFQTDVVSATGDYGLCQLNYRYFDPGMTPEENLAAGIGLLANNITRYGTVAAGLTAYNRGHDDGSRAYANAVLNKARAWGYTDD